MLRVVVNPGSGSDGETLLADQVCDAVNDCEVIRFDGDGDLRDVVVEAAAGTELIGVSGGDGTVSCVAAVALERDLPLLVVPDGTLNHFAKDVGIETVDDAIDAARGHTTHLVDVGIVDGRIFVNNASIGLYADLVDERERREHRFGKWLAALIATGIVLRRSNPTLLLIDGRPRRVWLAWFGNCRYAPSGLIGNGREQLDDGLIDVRLVHGDQRFSRLRLCGSLLVRRLDRCSVYEARTAASISISSPDGEPVRMAADGETFDGAAELTVSKRLRALRVCVPPSN